MPKSFGKFVARAKDAVKIGTKRDRDATGGGSGSRPQSLLQLPVRAPATEATERTSNDKGNRERALETGAGSLKLNDMLDVVEGNTDRDTDVQVKADENANAYPDPDAAGSSVTPVRPSAATTLVVDKTEGTGDEPDERVSLNKAGADGTTGSREAIGTVERTQITKTPTPVIPGSTEKFGLFQFPPKAATSSAFNTQAASSLQHVDIIVVHGVGGHWTDTWKASDGCIWPRDRIPALFSDTNINCRVRSFGYNSASFFTRAGIDIRDCAKDLIDRIRVLRRKDADEFRPIIFVAHSLGGILVKEAINRAWTRQSLYEDILSAVKGCIFLGVPHHGAAIARWAKHASQITKILTLGFAGNTSFLGTLEPDSTEWIRISDDFVDRGKDLKFYTFYETKKTGNIIVVDKSSAIMHLPNEQCFAVQGSDHRTVARFDDGEDERFSLVGDAVYSLVTASLKGKQQQASPQTMLSDLPPATSHFFGREKELNLLRTNLDPSRPRMKGIVLFGLAGSGKTQLVLNFIEERKAWYTAVFWINASGKEAISQSFADAECAITEMWPSKDLPNPTPRGSSAEKVVLSRLRSTVYSRWLLVIDSADDVETVNFASLIPARCSHGSVIVTSTRRSAADQFEGVGFDSQEIDSLDDRSAGRLLLSTATAPGATDREQNELELHGIPLALEQAGVLIRKRIVTFENFVEKYSTHYKVLMAKKPTRGVTLYEKEHSVVAIISLLFSALQDESPESARLLQVLCSLGRQSIPFDLLKSLAHAEPGIPSDDSLTSLVADDTLLMISISTLSDVCLLKFQDNQSQTQKIISVHGLICRWVVDMALPDVPGDLLWVVEGLVGFIQPEDDSPLSPYRPESLLTKKTYLPLLDHSIELVQTILQFDIYTAAVGEQVARIQQKLAYVYLAADRQEKATKLFETCIGLQRETEGDRWPSSEASLKLLVGLAVCRQHAKDHQAAIDALQSSVELAESLFDYFDDRTAEISTRLKAISERNKTGIKQHEAVLVASTGPKSREANLDRVETDQSRAQEEEGVYHAGELDADFYYSTIEPLFKLEQWYRLGKTLHTESWFDINALIIDKTPLMHALLEPTDNPAKTILKARARDIKVEARDEKGETALFYAAVSGHVEIVKTLMYKFGADPNAKNKNWQTPLGRAIRTNTKLETIPVLIDAGAQPDMPDCDGTTPFMLAADALDGELLDTLYHASGQNIPMNRMDVRANTVLHHLLLGDDRPSITRRELRVIFEKLIAWGAGVGVRNAYGFSPLGDGLTTLHDTSLVTVGLDPAITDANSLEKNGWTTLHVALRLGTLSLMQVRLLISYHESEINARDKLGRTPLMMATSTGRVTNLDALLDCDELDVDAQDDSGMSALFHAIAGGHSTVLEILMDDYPEIQLGSHGHGIGKEHNSILYAAVVGQETCLRILIGRSLKETRNALKVAVGKDMKAQEELIRRIAMTKYSGSALEFGVRRIPHLLSRHGGGAASKEKKQRDESMD